MKHLQNGSCIHLRQAQILKQIRRNKLHVIESAADQDAEAAAIASTHATNNHSKSWVQQAPHIPWGLSPPSLPDRKSGGSPLHYVMFPVHDALHCTAIRGEPHQLQDPVRGCSQASEGPVGPCASLTAVQNADKPSSNALEIEGAID